MASGQCYGCGIGFGMFKKEHGCKNCGFAFCSKCLTKILAVPKLNNAKHHVCNKCYDILTGKVQIEKEKSYSPPEAYNKRVAALEEKEKHPKPAAKIVGASQNKSKYIGLSKADREIAERLDKLREKTQPETKVTDKDIASRLSNLKDETPSTTQPTQKSKFYHPPDLRSQQKQVDDLLDEICDEVEIDSHQPNPVTDIQQRLEKLKGATNKDLENNLNKPSNMNNKPYSKNINQSAGQMEDNNDNTDMEEMRRLIGEASNELEVDANKAIAGIQKDKEIMARLSEIQNRKKNGVTTGDGERENKVSDEDTDSENEDEAIKRLVKRYLEESKLDDTVNEEVRPGNKDKPGKSISSGKEEAIPDDYDDNDELPYCSMCTEDATIRCVDCDMDLYCKNCFRESHDAMDIKDHRSRKYTAPKGYVN